METPYERQHFFSSLAGNVEKSFYSESFGIRVGKIPVSSLLRRGGATFWFQKHQNLDRILLQGRWLAHRTARIYINEGLAMLAKTQIDFHNAKLRSFLNIYHQTVTKPRFSTLEPPAAAGSAGGRGKSGKNKGCRARKRVKKCIFSADQG